MPDAITTLRTSRLQLVAWNEAHTALLTRLSALPEVVRFIGDGRPWAPSRAEEVSAAQLDHWRRHGFGWRAALDADSGEELGLIALNYPGDTAPELRGTDHEIGWWLDPSAWSRGIAREGGRAVCAEAFGRVGAPSVAARIQPANVRSLAVARALGLAPELDTVRRAGEPVVVLRLTREVWRASTLGAPGTHVARHNLDSSEQPPRRS